MICLAANPSADATFSVDRLEPGSIHRPSSHVRVAGGKALNVARAATRLGGEVTALALAPEHGAAWLREELAREGVALEVVTAPGVLRTCLSVYSAEDGSLTEFYEGGAAIDAPLWAHFSELAASRAQPGRWFVLSGSLPRGAPDDAYAELVRTARAAGAPVALDASGAELTAAVSAGPDLIKVNMAEALSALGRAGERVEAEAAVDLAVALRERASAETCAIVTLGEGGAVFAGPRDAAMVRLEDPPLPYAVGSGDAFLAGILIGRERSLDWDDSLRLAAGAGAANAAEPGQGRIEPARAEELAARVSIERS